MVEPFKINLPIMAAFLTIIGYSVNDTIVVFDRIREVRGKDPSLTRKMVNDSTNQTLSRTLLDVVHRAVGGGGALLLGRRCDPRIRLRAGGGRADRDVQLGLRGGPHPVVVGRQAQREGIRDEGRGIGDRRRLSNP